MSQSSRRPDVALGLLDAGVVTEDQLRDALQEQDGYVSVQIPLGRILLERGLVSKSLLRSRLEEQSEQGRKSGRRPPLGQLLLDGGWITEDQLHEALAAQEAASGIVRLALPLGKILAEQGIFNAGDLDEFLAYQHQDWRISIPPPPKRGSGLLRLLGVILLVGAYAAVIATILVRSFASLPPLQRPRAEVRGDWIFRNGEKFLVKGVGWDPARPGELPWSRSRDPETVADDFRRIREAGFNTIRTWDALSPEELAEAERQSLAVLQGIWVDPHGDFSDPQFRAEEIEKIRAVVSYSRASNTVVAYLVMNEPAPGHVLREGVETTRAFLREIAVSVRELDPGALVSFSNWPGAEMLREPELDLLSANLYPFRPGVLVDALGYEGMINLWSRHLAGERPLLVTEFGQSVALMANTEPDGPGGLDEAEHALLMPRLAEALVAGGAAGGVAFMWNDGWWKDHDEPGDENHHDPDDPEEWFGLVAMDSLGDQRGRPRPALKALRRWNRAVLTLPRSGPATSTELDVEIHHPSRADATVGCAIDGGPELHVPVVREGEWLRGRMGLPLDADEPVHLEWTIREGSEVVARSRRVVIPPAARIDLELTSEGGGSWCMLTVRARDSRGAALVDRELILVVTEPSRRADVMHRLVTDSTGKIRQAVQLPPPPGVALAVAAIRDGETPPRALTYRLLESGEIIE